MAISNDLEEYVRLLVQVELLKQALQQARQPKTLAELSLQVAQTCPVPTRVPRARIPALRAQGYDPWRSLPYKQSHQSLLY